MSSEFEGYVYRVGGMLIEGRTQWPTGAHLAIEQDQILLTVFVPRPSRAEVFEISEGKPVRFAWVRHGCNGFLLLKYGRTPWSDAPFNPQRLSEPFDLVAMPPGRHVRVVTLLVGADDGRIYAMRAFSWPAYFFNTVVASVHELAGLPYDEALAQAGQDQFYAEYPDSPSLYRLACTVDRLAKCTGGQHDDEPLGK